MFRIFSFFGVITAIHTVHAKFKVYILKNGKIRGKIWLSVMNAKAEQVQIFRALTDELLIQSNFSCFN